LATAPAARRTLYPEIEPHRTGRLRVSELHEIAFPHASFAPRLIQRDDRRRGCRRAAVTGRSFGDRFSHSRACSLDDGQ